MFNKINQYLIKRYPNIWNTRLVPILAITSFIHLLFFVIGYSNISQITPLHRSRYALESFEVALVSLSVIVSIVVLVIWLTKFLKNNSFKNYYPMSSFQLFGQFLQVFIIIFVSVTFTCSYYLGQYTFVEKTFPDEKFANMVKVSNAATPFIADNLADFELNKRIYPKEIAKLHCETSDKSIDVNEPYFSFLGEKYQFYTLRIDPRYNNRSIYGVKYSSNYYTSREAVRNDTTYVFYKDKVADVSAYIKSAKPSYRNFSKRFYFLDTEPLSVESSESSFDDLYYDSFREVKDRDISLAINQLMNKKNPDDFRQLFKEFLVLSDELKIVHNLKVEDWLQMVYHPEKDFEIQKFILSESELESFDERLLHDYSITDQRKLKYKYLSKRLSKSYYNLRELKQLFESIERIKSARKLLDVSHFLLWLAFGLSTVLFTFRVTNLQSILFGIVAAGILSVIIVVVAIPFGVSSVLWVLFFVLFLALVIYSFPLLFGKNYYFKKITAVSFVLILNSIPLLCLLVLLINKEMVYRFNEDLAIKYMSSDVPAELKKHDLLSLVEPETLGLSIFFVSLITLLVYTKVIFKWHASEE